MCNVSLSRVLFRKCVRDYIILLTCFVCVAVVWGSAVAAVIAMSKLEMTFTANEVTKYYRAGGLYMTVIYHDVAIVYWSNTIILYREQGNYYTLSIAINSTFIVQHYILF